MDAAGFWSYSHDDDERDNHGLLRLSEHIQAEYALVTGETLTLFVDRNSISWGDEWRRRIDAALAETTFFIPVITPLYFKRPECRNELLSFVGQAQSLGAIELVMPILYVDAPDLSEDSSDEACALVARMQYVDWRPLRLSGQDSTEYKRAVNSLALRLAEVSRQYEQSDNRQVIDDNAEESPEEGIIDLLGAVEQKLPRWQELFDEIYIANEQAESIFEPYLKRLNRLEKSRPNTGAILTIFRNLTRDIDPLSRRLLQLTKDYLAASIELDPLILKILRFLDVYPEFSGYARATFAPVESAARQINGDETIKSAPSNWAVLNRYQGMSKDLGRMTKLVHVIDRYTDDANALLSNWAEKIGEFKAVKPDP